MVATCGDSGAFAVGSGVLACWITKRDLPATVRHEPRARFVGSVSVGGDPKFEFSVVIWSAVNGPQWIVPIRFWAAAGHCDAADSPA